MKLLVGKVDLEMLLNGNAREQIIAAHRLRKEISTNSQGPEIRSLIESVVSNIGEIIEQIEDENLLSAISAELDNLVIVVETLK